MCLVLLCVCGFEACCSGKPGAPVTAGSLDSSLPQLASLLCFIPRSQTPAEGEKKLLSPGCCSFTLSSARSLSLTIHPSLLGSPPPIRFLVTPASLSLCSSLFWLLVSSFLCHKNTHAHTLDPKASLNDRLQEGRRKKQREGEKSNLNQTVASLQH